MQRHLDSGVAANAFQVQTQALVGIEDLTKAELDGAGVSTITIPYYLAYARQLYRLTKTATGVGDLGTATLESCILIDMWVARGLTESVLLLIHSNVFGLGSCPEPPPV